MGTVSRSQESLKDEPGSEGKAPAKRAAYRRDTETLLVTPASESQKISRIVFF